MRRRASNNSGSRRTTNAAGNSFHLRNDWLCFLKTHYNTGVITFTWQETGTALIGIAGVLTAARTIWSKAISPAIDLAQSVVHLNQSIAYITAQLAPNGGASLRDTIDRVERRVRIIDERAAVIDARHKMLLNQEQFVYFEAAGEPALYARVTEIRGKTAVLRTLKDFNHQKNAVWGVTTRNREQNFAMNLLTDPDIDFVTLAGTAGTGKTLMALAAGLTQVLDERRYTEIIMTRATVSVGEDIGFLPGTEEEKMGPWMGALDDNLEFLAKGDGGGAGEWGRAATNELIKSRIKIKSMNFMRGRTFMNKYVIIDEAQNLTPKQMKTLITRAGPGTKIICMGNLAQIDTPYLTEGSSGLTYAVDRFKGWAHGGHITLARGERSRLADFASETL